MTYIDFDGNQTVKFTTHRGHLNWGQSLVCGEHKHFDNPPRANASHSWNSSISDCPRHLVHTPTCTPLNQELRITSGEDQAHKSSMYFLNCRTPHILCDLLMICQTAFFWADTFGCRLPIRFKNSFHTTRTL